MKCPPEFQKDFEEAVEAAFKLGRDKGRDKGIELGEERAAISYISIIQFLNKQCDKLCETILILAGMKYKKPQYKKFTNNLITTNKAARKEAIRRNKEDELGEEITGHFELSKGDKHLLADILKKS